MNLRRVINLEVTSNIVKGENDDVSADFRNIFKRWKTYFHQILTVRVHGLNDVTQTEMHAAEPLVPGPTYFEIEIATEKL
jgi:hypothetical protein